MTSIMRKYLHTSTPSSLKVGWDKLYKQALDCLEAKGLKEDWRYMYLLESSKCPEEALRRLSWISMRDLERDLAK